MQYARTTGFAAFLFVVLLPLMAWGQTRVVVFEVDGYTERLEASLAEIPGVEVRSQSWFVDQVRDAGKKPSKITERDGDLRFVMAAGGIAHIVGVKPAGSVWEVFFFDDDGTESKKFELDRPGKELSMDDVVAIRRTFAAHIGVELPPENPAEPRASAPVETPARVEKPERADVVVEAEEEAPVEDEVEPGEPGRFRARASGGVIKRDLSVAGTNGAILTFRSAFYPGGRVGFEVRDLVGPVGLAVDGAFGSDSITTEDGAVSVLHLEAGVDLVFGIGDFRLGVGARHVRFDLADNPALASMDTTYVHLGAAHSVRLATSLRIDSVLDLYPYGFPGSQKPLFGESALTYGFGGDLRLVYEITRSFGLGGGIWFRSTRADYSGTGTADFVDARAFELVWAPDLGVTFSF